MRWTYRTPAHRELSAFRLVAKLPTITAMAYKYNVGQPFIYPRNNLSYAENFMHMMFATPAEEYKPNPVLAHALDRILILHADHEQNASTSTVGSPVPAAQIRSPAFQPGLPVYGGRRMVEPTRRA